MPAFKRKMRDGAWEKNQSEQAHRESFSRRVPLSQKVVIVVMCVLILFVLILAGVILSFVSGVDWSALTLKKQASGTQATVSGAVTTTTVAETVTHTEQTTSSGIYEVTGPFVWPTPCTRNVTQQFGNNGYRGVDIWKADMTGEDILAADGGTVEKAGEYDGYSTYGKFVIIDHGNGYKTVYAHCSEVLVEEGQVVEQGQLIALVGNTGRSMAPHLYFEVLLNGAAIDPMQFFE